MKRSKITSHEIGQDAENIIRQIIDQSHKAYFRNFTGRDYGLDAIVELFEDGCITGKFAFLQCKGKGEVIEQMARNNGYVSCNNISLSNMYYAEQENVLVLLAYASVKDKGMFYYINLSDVLNEDTLNKIKRCQKNFTIRIPASNNTRDNLEGFFEIIDNYYKNLKG